MHLSEDDVKRIFDIIDKCFEHAVVLAEVMNPTVAKRYKEKSIEGSKAKFIFLYDHISHRSLFFHISVIKYRKLSAVTQGKLFKYLTYVISHRALAEIQH